MDIKLFGKYFKYALTLIVVIEAISLLVIAIPALKTVTFLVLIFIAFLLSLKNIHYGLYLILAELFIGGKGHLFSMEVFGFDFSIRMALFIILFLAWFWQFIKKREVITLDKIFLSGYFILFIFAATGLINGLLNNQKLNVLFDFNAWLYFALIIVFLNIIKTKETTSNILQIFTAATTYLSLKTIILLILFAHDFSGGDLIYQWVRDTGVGEITYVAGNIFRIFMQSQMYLLPAFFLGLTLLLMQNKITTRFWGLTVYVYLSGFALLISQSRSFWVGLTIGLVIIILLAIWQLSFRIKKTLLTLVLLILITTSQIFLLQAITGNFGNNVVEDRFKNLTGEAAGISRLNQLRPLSSAIIQQFIFGYGFGKTVTYQSSDPRILQNNPSGVYTTYAFEWGYLDIILKIGLLGFLAYLYLLFQIIHQGLKKITSQKVIVIGTLSALTAILATNVFSPYLNHPLGIGYLILISSIYQTKN